jgi:hypothetical protein
LGHLLARLEDHLLALLAGLLAQLIHLPLGLLADGSGVDQLLALSPGLVNDFIGLLAGFANEVLPLADQFVGLGNLLRQGFPEGVHHFDGVLLIHQPPTTEWNAAAFQNDVLQLIQLVKNGDADLCHVNRGAMPD